MRALRLLPPLVLLAACQLAVEFDRSRLPPDPDAGDAGLRPDASDAGVPLRVDASTMGDGAAAPEDGASADAGRQDAGVGDAGEDDRDP
jgi:hypothetical protein